MPPPKADYAAAPLSADSAFTPSDIVYDTSSRPRQPRFTADTAAVSAIAFSRPDFDRRRQALRCRRRPCAAAASDGKFCAAAALFARRAFLFSLPPFAPLRHADSLR